MKVLVTPTSLSRGSEVPALARLREFADEVVLNPHGRPLTSEELREALPGVDGVVAGLDPYDAEALAAADSLRVISRYGAGVDRVDLDAARERGIVVTRTPGANAMAVAELTIGLAFSVARSIPRLDSGVRAGEWLRTEGRELTGAVFGVIGFGAIGRLVAERARGIGMRVLAYDPFAPPEAFAAEGVEQSDLDALCARSDVVSVHVPFTPETRHLLDERRLAMLPADAIVINTARGGLVDESAARAALDSGHLFGVGVDVYETEPPSDSPLLGHPRIVATPHAGAHTREAVQRTSERAVDNLIAVLRGEESADAIG